MTTDHYISRDEIISIGKEVAHEAIKELFDPNNPSAVVTISRCELQHANIKLSMYKWLFSLIITGLVGGAAGGTLSFTFKDKQATKNGVAIQNLIDQQTVNESLAARDRATTKIDRAVTKEDRAEHKGN